jgi:hypothetical protein
MNKAPVRILSGRGLPLSPTCPDAGPNVPDREIGRSPQRTRSGNLVRIYSGTDSLPDGPLIMRSISPRAHTKGCAAELSDSA